MHYRGFRILEMSPLAFYAFSDIPKSLEMFNMLVYTVQDAIYPTNLK